MSAPTRPRGPAPAGPDDPFRDRLRGAGAACAPDAARASGEPR